MPAIRARKTVRPEGLPSGSLDFRAQLTAEQKRDQYERIMNNVEQQGCVRDVPYDHVTFQKPEYELQPNEGPSVKPPIPLEKIKNVYHKWVPLTPQTYRLVGSGPAHTFPVVHTSKPPTTEEELQEAVVRCYQYAKDAQQPFFSLQRGGQLCLLPERLREWTDVSVLQLDRQECRHDDHSPDGGGTYTNMVYRIRDLDYLQDGAVGSDYQFPYFQYPAPQAQNWKACQQNSEKTWFEPLSYQRFLEYTVHPKSESKGKLVFWSAGAGKTYGAASVINEFMLEGWAIKWTTRDTLKSVMFKEVYHRLSLRILRAIVEDDAISIPFGDRVYRTAQEKFELAKTHPNAYSKPPFNIVLPKYNVLSYSDFIRMLAQHKAAPEPMRAAFRAQTERDEAHPHDLLHKTLLIIDEAHNLLGGMTPEERGWLDKPMDTYSVYGTSSKMPIGSNGLDMFIQYIKHSFRTSGNDSCKVLLLTATPAVNGPQDLLTLLNLVSVTPPRSVSYYLERPNQYLKFISGKVSYIDTSKDIDRFAQVVLRDVITVPFTDVQRHRLDQFVTHLYKDPQYTELTPSQKAHHLWEIYRNVTLCAFDAQEYKVYSERQRKSIQIQREKEISALVGIYKAVTQEELQQQRARKTAEPYTKAARSSSSSSVQRPRPKRNRSKTKTHRSRTKGKGRTRRSTKESHSDPTFVETKSDLGIDRSQFDRSSFLRSDGSWMTQEEFLRSTPIHVGLDLLQPEQNIAFGRHRKGYDAKTIQEYLPVVSPVIQAIVNNIRSLEQINGGRGKHLIFTFSESGPKRTPFSFYGTPTIASLLDSFPDMTICDRYSRGLPTITHVKEGQWGVGLLSSRSMVNTQGKTIEWNERTIQGTQDVFNDPGNQYGKYMKIMVADGAFVEGISLHDVDYIHLCGLPLYHTSAIQAFARSTRNCKSTGLPYEPGLGAEISLYVYQSIDQNGRRMYSELISRIPTSVLQPQNETEILMTWTKQGADDADFTRVIHRYARQARGTRLTLQGTAPPENHHLSTPSDKETFLVGRGPGLTTTYVLRRQDVLDWERGGQLEFTIPDAVDILRSHFDLGGAQSFPRPADTTSNSTPLRLQFPSPRNLAESWLHFENSPESLLILALAVVRTSKYLLEVNRKKYSLPLYVVHPTTDTEHRAFDTFCALWQCNELHERSFHVRPDVWKRFLRLNNLSVDTDSKQLREEKISVLFLVKRDRVCQLRDTFVAVDVLLYSPHWKTVERIDPFGGTRSVLHYDDQHLDSVLESHCRQYQLTYLRPVTWRAGRALSALHQQAPEDNVTAAFVLLYLILRVSNVYNNRNYKRIERFDGKEYAEYFAQEMMTLIEERNSTLASVLNEYSGLLRNTTDFTTEFLRTSSLFDENDTDLWKPAVLLLDGELKHTNQLKNFKYKAYWLETLRTIGRRISKAVWELLQRGLRGNTTL